MPQNSVNIQKKNSEKQKHPKSFNYSFII